MAENFLGEIRNFSFGLVPMNWIPCNGQLLAINSNQALFSLLGTAFGGNGSTTFAVPDLRGRFSVGLGTNYSLGMQAGEAAHTLTTSEMPAHVHPISANNSGANLASPVNAYPAATANASYSTTADTTLGAGSSGSGASQPHPNMSPYLALNFCIALTGIYPLRS